MPSPMVPRQGLVNRTVQCVNITGAAIASAICICPFPYPAISSAPSDSERLPSNASFLVPFWCTKDMQLDIIVGYCCRLPSRQQIHRILKHFSFWCISLHPQSPPPQASDMPHKPCCPVHTPTAAHCNKQIPRPLPCSESCSQIPVSAPQKYPESAL